MDIVIKIILFTSLSLSVLLSIGAKEAIESMQRDFKTSKNNKVVLQNTPKIGQEEDLLDILSKEVWSSFDKNTPTKIHSQNLKNITEAQKVSYMRSTKRYTGEIDYIDSVIDKELTNYMTWVVIIQSFVIILFIILYIDLNWKIENISLKKKTKDKKEPANNDIVSSVSIDAQHKQNLRKTFL